MADAITNLSWASLPGSGDGVLVTLDFGSLQTIAGVELVDADLSGARVESALVAEHSPDGAGWARFPDEISLGDIVQTRRIMAPPGFPVSARYVRLLQKTPSETSGRSLAIGGLRVLTEGAAGAAKVEPFTYDDDAAYVMIYSAENAEVYAGPERKASVRTPFIEGSLARLDFTQRLDTQLVFHENYAPWRVFRLGADDAWDARDLEFDSMRKVEFDDTTYTNGVNEVQQLEFFEFTNGETFNITLDGQTTGSIAFNSTGATLGASIKAAIEALPIMGGGTVTVANPSTNRFTITFGGEAGQMDWPEMAPRVVSSAAGVVTAATLTAGKAGGEDAISATRGWPRCGLFTDSRLILAGLRSLPQTAIVSKLGEYFSFETTNGRATDAYEFTIDTKDANGIRRIFESDTVQLFTASGVHFLGNAALVADEPTERNRSGSLGIQITLPPVEIDGGTVYVQKGGRGVRELMFDANTKRYTPISLFVRAPSLINKPVDIYARKTGVNFEDELLGIVNEDGVCATFTSLKEQNVSACARDRIDGSLIAAGADSLARVFYVTEREVNGETVRYIEVEDPARTLDCSVIRELEEASEITGLEHLEGRADVYVVGLGRWWGPLEVEDGALDLGEEVTGSLEVGLFFEAFITTLEPRFDTQRGSLLNAQKRVLDVTVSVLDSTLPGLTYRHDDKTRTYEFKDPRPISRALDRGPLEAPLFTGASRIEGIPGWGRSVDVTIFRRMPGPFHIRSLKMGVQV